MTSATAPAASAPLTAAWTDPKRYLWLLGLVGPLIPPIGWGLVEASGLGVMWWFGPAFVFGVIPLLDLIVGKDSADPPDSAIDWLEQDRYYRWCTYLFLPLQFASLVFACWIWSSGDLSVLESLGLALSVGVVGGIAINTAHELGHKRKQAERWLSKIALAQTGYGHFFIEHNRGHHVRVATPEDPASSRLGESFYAFLPRTVWGSLKSALHLEKVRLARVGKPLLSVHNDVLNAWAMTLVLFAALTSVFGVEVLPWLVVQAVVGLSLLEVVNYLEHYGLLRGKREDGRYELTRPEHSWNSDNVTSNVFLYHLQRHSDHHANPVRRYQALRHYDDLPELPSGYATMILFAYLPPVWRRVMDPKVLAHYDGDITRANVQPRERERLLAKYGSSGGARPANARPTLRRYGSSGGARPANARPTPRVGNRAAVLASGAGGQRAMAAYQCPACEYVYEEAAGELREGFPAGTPWSDVPDDWTCPDCAVREKVDFEPVSS